MTPRKEINELRSNIAPRDAMTYHWKGDMDEMADMDEEVILKLRLGVQPFR